MSSEQPENRLSERRTVTADSFRSLGQKLAGAGQTAPETSDRGVPPANGAPIASLAEAASRMTPEGGQLVEASFPEQPSAAASPRLGANSTNRRVVEVPQP